MAVRYEPGSSGTSRTSSRTRYQGATPPKPAAPLNRSQSADAARYAGLANQYANRAQNTYANRYQAQANAYLRQQQALQNQNRMWWDNPTVAGQYTTMPGSSFYNPTLPASSNYPSARPQPYQMARQNRSGPNPYNVAPVPTAPRPAVTRPRYSVDTWNNDDITDWINYSTTDRERAENWANSSSNPANQRGSGGGGYGGYGGYGGGGGGYTPAAQVPEWYMNLGMWRI